MLQDLTVKLCCVAMKNKGPNPWQGSLPPVHVIPAAMYLSLVNRMTGGTVWPLSVSSLWLSAEIRTIPQVSQGKGSGPEVGASSWHMHKGMASHSEQMLRLPARTWCAQA